MRSRSDWAPGGSHGDLAAGVEAEAGEVRQQQRQEGAERVLRAETLGFRWFRHVSRSFSWVLHTDPLPGEHLGALWRAPEPCYLLWAARNASP